MIFQQFEVDGLSHYSYAIGCNESKEIAIVDPKRDFDTYLKYANDNGFKIRYVLETHIHADYASGARELAGKTGAELMLSAYDTNEQFEVQYPHEELEDGDIVQMGNIKLVTSHTPGHTPEHISFLVYDLTREKNQPILMFSGDFLFVGSVGRPDLLGDQETEHLARKLFHSVKKLRSLPDEMEVYPGHGAGSLCGSGMTSANHSILGLERKTNPYLDENLDEEAFVDKVLNNVPPFPEYYKRMKRVNSEGAPILNGLPSPPEADLPQIKEALENNHVILDVRHPLAFGGGHIPGSLNIESGSMISQWAPWLVPYDVPVFILADSPEKFENTVRRLIQVGLDDINGVVNGVAPWISAGEPYSNIPQVPVKELARLTEGGKEFTILDVRTKEEYQEGHVEGAVNIFLGELPRKVKEIDSTGNPIYTICGGGFRSSAAASILRGRNLKRIRNVFGGMDAWKTAGLPLEEE